MREGEGGRGRERVREGGREGGTEVILEFFFKEGRASQLTPYLGGSASDAPDLEGKNRKKKKTGDREEKRGRS